MEKAIYLAGGCFWGVERYYQLLEGILDTEVGYANGNFANPTYEDLKAHRASHVEAVKVVYDEEKIQLTQLLEHLFRIINPFTVDHQGGDYGHQYRTGIYYIEEEDKKIIQEFITNEQRKYKQKIRVEVEKLNHFYKAEDYHQNYLKKNPFGYCHVDFSVIKKEERKK
ncbi:MAG TPA: peptide-methionine (S)-S-oxide reductase MsrA [Bacilli bacterium]|jgi:methionine-S-sulfoxide reductase|nr:peptide-methionine (S)-S-oxide reductase MsrA [Acholeplasmataceae bacterium]HNZ78134.1 peptide-methionine (S)-S-oxide reductase MsrA [Bacilli bacterium]HOD61190.1 peptide-methionine (S)-S-oxide reductase MsrA [Bacilli bacterium]HOH61991.1 peptide-methionine (S)-S-oxide reductase MsrA [Bacilli bacterium]HPB49402.1 peptide-methionine (S)-S-oxide reductase MsrA [Bacilli bacterium]